MASLIKRFDRWFVHPGYLIWAAIVYGLFLSHLSIPVTGDEKQYLSTAVEMLEKKSWLKPMLFGASSYYKPPLQYWMSLLSLKVLGYSLWAALVPSALAALGTAFFLGEISLLLNERRELVRSGLWFMASVGAVTYGVVAQMEIYLCLFLAAAWWAVLKWVSEPIETRSDRYLFLAFTFAGLLSLVKSPLYFALWSSGLFIFMLISGEWESFRSKNLYWAGFWGALVGASWYIVILCIDRERFWADYVVRETVGKNSGNHTAPYQIWFALTYLALPMTLLFFPSIRIILRRRKAATLFRLAISWTLPLAVFFTVFPYRVNTYLFVLVPVIALIVDWGTIHDRKAKTVRILFSATALAFALAFVTLAAIVFKTGLFPKEFGFALTAASLVYLFAVYRSSARSLLVSSLLGATTILALVGMAGKQDLAGLKLALANHSRTQAVAMIDLDRDIWHDVGMVSLAVERPILRVQTLGEAVELLARDGIVIFSEKQFDAVFGEFKTQWEAKHSSRKMHIESWIRWGRRKDTKFAQALREKDPVVVRNSLVREYRIIWLED